MKEVTNYLQSQAFYVKFLGKFLINSRKMTNKIATERTDFWICAKYS